MKIAKIQVSLSPALGGVELQESLLALDTRSGTSSLQEGLSTQSRRASEQQKALRKREIQEAFLECEAAQTAATAASKLQHGKMSRRAGAAGPQTAAGDRGAQLRSSVPVIHLSEETGQAAHLGPVAARAVGSKRGACSSAALGTLWLAAVDTDGA